MYLQVIHFTTVYFVTRFLVCLVILRKCDEVFLPLETSKLNVGGILTMLMIAQADYELYLIPSNTH